MAIYSEFSHWKWWFSIAPLNYQWVSENTVPPKLTVYFTIKEILSSGMGISCLLSTNQLVQRKGIDGKDKWWWMMINSEKNIYTAVILGIGSNTFFIYIYVYIYICIYIYILYYPYIYICIHIHISSGMGLKFRWPLGLTWYFRNIFFGISPGVTLQGSPD